MFNGISETCIKDEKNKQNVSEIILAFNTHIDLCISHYVQDLMNETITIFSQNNNILSMLQDGIRERLSTFKQQKERNQTQQQVMQSQKTVLLNPLEVNKIDESVSKDDQQLIVTTNALVQQMTDIERKRKATV